MSEQKIPIPAMLYNAAVGGHVTNSQQIIDENLNREQNDINQETVGAVPYNSTTPNGMGRIVLKKTDNFKEVVEAQTNGNTIFVIKYDFTLTGNVTVPANCVLEFDGGSISGENTITGNNTVIQAGLVKIFGIDIIVSGAWANIESYPEWFGAICDNSTDSTSYVQKTISLNTDYVIISKHIKFQLRNLSFNAHTNLKYNISSDLSNYFTDKPNSGELVVYSANSSYPEQSGGGEVNEHRFEGQLHPAFIANVRKDVHGHDEYLSPAQIANPFARASYLLKDENVNRAMFHYKNHKTSWSQESCIGIFPDAYIVTVNIGSDDWNTPPTLFDSVTQKEGNDIIGAGFIIQQESHSTKISWCSGKFVANKPLYLENTASNVNVTQVSTNSKGLANITSTNYKDGWAIGIPASMSKALLAVGGRICVTNTDITNLEEKTAEPGVTFAYYNSVVNREPYKVRNIVLNKLDSASRRLVVTDESDNITGHVGACCAYAHLFVYNGNLVAASGSGRFNIKNPTKIPDRIGEYTIEFDYERNSTAYVVSLTTEDPLIYACATNKNVNGFTLKLFTTGTNTPVDITSGVINLICVGGDF